MALCKTLSNFTKRLESLGGYPHPNQMETTAEKTTQISVGTSTHRDFFQRGREAAQMAKTQHSNDSPSLVLALSDTGVHFKDFIEGVRLVMGEDLLIGLPREPWLAQDAPSHETGAVVIITSKTNDFFVTPHRTSIHHLEVGTTHLAAAAHRHQSNGLVVFGEEDIIAEQHISTRLDCRYGSRCVERRGRMGFQIEQLDLVCQNQFFKSRRRRHRRALERTVARRQCGVGIVSQPTSIFRRRN